MGNRMGQILLKEIEAQIEQVAADSVDFRKLTCAQTVDKNVDLEATLGEVGGHLHADKNLIRVLLLQKQHPLQTVVISDGHQIHAPLYGTAKDQLRIGIRLPSSQGLEDPLGGPLGMDTGTKMLAAVVTFSAILFYLLISNWLSYGLLKQRTLRSRRRI